MQRIANLDDRIDALVHRVLDNTERRDQLISEASLAVQDYRELQPHLSMIQEARYQEIPHLVSKAASLARTVETSAALAESSSAKVKRLNEVLQRVKAAKLVAESRIAMDQSLADVPTTLKKGDYTATVELLRSYEEARQIVTGSSTSPSTGVSAGVSTGGDASSQSQVNVSKSTNPVVTAACAETREILLTKTKEAMTCNEKLTIMDSAKLLARLGYTSEASSLYCGWIGDHTIAALQKMVKRELRHMADPTTAAMSHLTLVSQALDTVVATYETEEEFVREQLDPSGPRLLLQDLHTRSSAECVPVLEDFVSKRKAVLDAVSSGVSSGRPGSPTTSGAEPVSRSSAADARRADQLLEELGHLVSCCHIYVSFVQEKLSELQKPSHGAEGPSATTVSTSKRATPKRVTIDDMWVNGDGNELLQSVQHILGLYVPLQTMYFDIAFNQAMELQLTAMRDVRERIAKNRDGAGVANHASSAAASPTSLMAGLSSLYSGAAGETEFGPGYTPTGLRDEDNVWSPYYVHGGGPSSLTLVEDVFFFIRIAVHRSMNTKSTQITSAVIVSAADVVQSRLLTYIQGKLRIERPEVFPPPGALCWACAGHVAVDYAGKLATEVERLALATFGPGRDHNRFGELAQNFSLAAQDFTRNGLETTLRQDFATSLISQVHTPAWLENLRAVDYAITEEVYYQRELSDPWVQEYITRWSTVLDYVKKYLTEPHCFDQLLSAIAKVVVELLRDQLLLAKRYSSFGALQVDKEVRAIRAFFLAAVHDISLTAIFKPVTELCVVLLAETPAEAVAEVDMTIITKDQLRQALQRRVEFNAREIQSLRL